MHAAVLHAAGDLRIEERGVPEPGAGEVLVRVGVCGVCGSDATEYDRGPQLTVLPVTLGHEFAGVVVRSGPGASLPVGARVVGGAGISCGRCKPCRGGRTNLCREYRTAGLQRDGGLAGFIALPESALLDVSGSPLAMDTLGLAQPMAIAVHAVRRSGLRADQDAVIVGVGGIGAFLTVAAVATGARVLVVDLNADRLELARRLGAHEALVAGEAELSARLDDLGMDADVFFEVSGSRPGWDSVIAAARPGATVVPVGIQKGEVPADLAHWTLAELTIVGTVAHVIAEDLPDAVRLLESRATWDEIASTVLPLDRVVDGGLAPLIAGHPDQTKTLIDPWADRPRPADHGRSLT